jgi:galactokinase/mevalonate kinase-like predicted kinase
LPPGACLDFVPLDARRVAIRFYRLDDTFAGDEQRTPRFPVLETGTIDGALLESLFARPVPVGLPLLSAQQLMERVDLRRLLAAQRARRAAVLEPLARNHARSVFYNLDLAATAQLYARTRQPLPPPVGGESLKMARDRMFRAAVLRNRRLPGADRLEAEAFARLRAALVQESQLPPVTPRRCVLDDQIVWGRSPVRLDLAGGWTDTPPYCLQHGGRVVNVAVNLNGQPPIQVFARVTDRPELVIRSIDLGVEERVCRYAQLRRYDRVGSGFTIAKAALAMAGFLPAFHANGGAADLPAQLRAFGGGIELSLLCAVPKGSGLGTSSILAATVLGTLNELCGLGWDTAALSQRTLALEQMLTTGGGWQDQVGGLTRGVKLIETAPGLAQQPVIRWLPAELFGPAHANQTMLLYYTGITRVAKNILQEIVRGIFLNAHAPLAVVHQIGENARRAATALERADRDALAAAVRTSWDLNRQLDRGTNPPSVQAILNAVADELVAAKLLGAGGGGYLLLLAKDVEAGQRIRRRLTQRPPNARARFVDFAVSPTGFEVTRS